MFRQKCEGIDSSYCLFISVANMTKARKDCYLIRNTIREEEGEIILRFGQEQRR